MGREGGGGGQSVIFPLYGKYLCIESRQADPFLTQLDGNQSIYPCVVYGPVTASPSVKIALIKQVSAALRNENSNS